MVVVRTDWEEVYRQLYQDVVRFLYRKVWDADHVLVHLRVHISPVSAHSGPFNECETR